MQYMWYKLYALWDYQWNLRHERVVATHEHSIEVEYTYRSSEYRIVIPKRRVTHPLAVVRVLDENDNDMYDHFVQLLGPMKDFHNQRITPGLIGQKQIRIFTFDRELVYGKDDIINPDDLLKKPNKKSTGSSKD